MGHSSFGPTATAVARSGSDVHLLNQGCSPMTQDASGSANLIDPSDDIVTPQPWLNRPHLVILGAGASLAALPNGDRRGRRLPLMSNLVEVLGLRAVIRDHNIPYHGEDFETFFSDLAVSGKHQSCVQAMEKAIFDYFGTLELPECPTIYDHLVLSLRPKDVIATFNWDPFLWQALNRNGRVAPMPQALFLHGNVAIGYCFKHTPHSMGSWQLPCIQCGARRVQSRLLYPVKVKNYDNDPMLSATWADLRGVLEAALLFTVFGYSAPKTDIEAKRLLQEGWGESVSRVLEDFEILDIARHADLVAAWKTFICRDHYQIREVFWESVIAKYPRRSCEAIWAGNVDAQFARANPTPRDADWDSLREFYSRLVEEESSDS